MILLVVRIIPCIRHPGSLANGNSIGVTRDDLDGRVVGLSDSTAYFTICLIGYPASMQVVQLGRKARRET